MTLIFFFSNTKEGAAIKLWDQEMKRCRSLSLGPGPSVVRSVCRGKVSTSDVKSRNGRILKSVYLKEFKSLADNILLLYTTLLT